MIVVLFGRIQVIRRDQQRNPNTNGRMRVSVDIALIVVAMSKEAYVPSPGNGLVHYGRRNVLTNKSLYNGISLF